MRPPLSSSIRSAGAAAIATAAGHNTANAAITVAAKHGIAMRCMLASI
jgi:hypothetical protein